MFFQQTSTARMIDHIVTSSNSLYRINHGSCPAQVSRHPEYHCFSEDCDLRNRISHSIVIKIHDLCYIYRPQSEARKKVPRNIVTSRSPRVPSWIAELKWHIVCAGTFHGFPTYFSPELFFREELCAAPPNANGK